MAAFDAYIMVDWSAAAVPTRGKDSIWIACVCRHDEALRRVWLENPGTRSAASRFLRDRLARMLDDDLRVLVGFDFPFGYPRGTAAALGLGRDGLLWRKTWAEIGGLLQDADNNANNRFDVGAALNRRLSGGSFPFWGRPGGDAPHLGQKKPRAHGPDDPPERRLCEERVRRTKTVWQLAYTGSVGSQVLTGLPRVWEVRTDPRLAFRTLIWPFETGLADTPEARCVLAEIYPSLVPPIDFKDKPKDAGQVAAMSRRLGELDAAGRLGPLFGADPALTEAERDIVVREEAWILGLTGRPEMTP